MIEISLHILDLIENSINAGAKVVYLKIEVDTCADLLQITIEDDGKGFPMDVETVVNPFFTTKQMKSVGLGLSLSKSSAEQAGGGIELGNSEHLGGAKVVLIFKKSHIDRAPMGDLGNALTGMMFTNMNISFVVEIYLDNQLIYFLESSNESHSVETVEKYVKIANDINKVINTLGI